MMPVADLFSKRDSAPPTTFTYGIIPAKLRIQIRWLWDTWLDSSFVSSLISARKTVCEEHGLEYLCKEHLSPIQDAEHFMASDSPFMPAKQHVALDMIEYVSYSQIEFLRMWDATPDEWDLRMSIDSYVSTLNCRFLENGVGYQFDMHSLRLVRLDSEATHENITKPVLSLLSSPKRSSANHEYIQACEDFKHSDYADCIGKCGMAFESVMKIICEEKSWTYNQSDTASKLLNIIYEKSPFEPYLREQLMQTATMRNRCFHGAGTQTRIIPPHLASYALNVSASAILLLTEITQTRHTL